MGPPVYRRTTCRLCGGTDLDLVLKLKPTPIADAFVPKERLNERQEIYPLDLFLCRNCGHAHLLDVIDPEVLYGNYLYTTTTSLGLDEHYREYAEQIAHAAGLPQDALVVEIGSNDGTLLKCFKNLGLRVLGIDPACEVARRATRAGVETLAEFFTAELGRKLRKERGPATIIAANNVIANIDNVGDMVDGVRELLAPDGVFVFETGYLADIIQNLLFETIYHEHLDYHAVGPLTKFFPRHGLQLIDVKRIPTKGGSLRGVVQRVGGPRSVSSAVAELARLETELGFVDVKTYAAYAARIERLKQELLQLLRRLKAEAKTIAGFGASHSVTTLTHHFELGEFLSFVVDDNPKKQGLYSPGYHTPVLPTTALLERKPDYVLVLAWRFLKPFMEKNRAYLEQGGHFIVPLPELKVI